MPRDDRGVANPNSSEELPSWLSIPLPFFFLAELCSRAACAAQVRAGWEQGVRHRFIHQAGIKRPFLGLLVALTCGSGLYRPQ